MSRPILATSKPDDQAWFHGKPTCGRQSVQRHSKHVQQHPKPTAAILLVAIPLAAIIALNFTADARLIHIYHRYRPSKISADDQLNQSSSLISQTIQQQAADEMSRANEKMAIEYSSPMKRIMDLIGYHSPIIVVNSDSGSSTNQEEATTKITDTQTPSLAPPGGQQQVAATINNIEQQQQAAPQLQQLLAQQQQLVQSSVPYGQYYTFAPSHIATDQAGNQITVLPAAGFASTFSPAPNAFQQLAMTNMPYTPVQTEQSQHYQQQLIQQEQNSNQAQPVFLSSYVPEIPAQALKPTFNGLDSLPTQFANYQQQPNSIQQIQQQQSTSKDASADPKDTDNKSDTEQNDDEQGAGGKPTDENNQEDEDSGKTKRQSSSLNTDSDEPTNGGSGSTSYEDKYDSDKDGQQPAKYKAEPSTVVNGLVSVGLNDDCLQCICRASSGCDHMLRCITLGSEEKYCGPFQLTEEYWNKAGSPGDASNNFSSFEDCANEPDCAVETVTNYMKKYYRDCDGDENITCMDYARLHRLQPNECDNTDKLMNNFDAYWAKFQRCAEGYNRTRNGDDEDI